MGDLISRQAVLDGIDKYIEKSQSTGTIDDFNSFAELIVKTLPSAENKGEWLIVVDKYYEDGRIKENHWECSKCGSGNSGWGEYKFCPDCGADMRKNNC